MPAEGEMRLDRRSLSVYVITSSGFVPERGHLEVGLAAIEGGATAVQLRAPSLADAELLPIARELAERARASDVLFIVNDRVEVAVRAGASGAHVGQDDDPAGARSALGPAAVLGVSVANADEARRAQTVGADYVGVTVWSTSTKPEAVGVGVSGLQAVVDAIELPVVGVGGIGPHNARDVLRAGAAGVAVVSAVGAAPDPVAATAELAAAVREELG
jgi:thiamine-phosphate pyrophosphorylase